MGNCQAIDAAALVIQHPSGRLERLYWPIPVSEVMKMNPGHYVSLIIPLPVSQEEEANHHQDRDTVRFTCVKLLRPTDTLTLGHAYRLITSQEVMKFMRAKKYAKTKRESMKKLQHHGQDNLTSGGKSDAHITNQELKNERQISRTSSVNAASMRSKSWRPSLQSISEAEIIWESLSSKPPNHDQGGFGPITRMPEQQQVLQVRLIQVEVIFNTNYITWINRRGLVTEHDHLSPLITSCTIERKEHSILIIPSSQNNVTSRTICCIGFIINRIITSFKHDEASQVIKRVSHRSMEDDNSMGDFGTRNAKLHEGRQSNLTTSSFIRKYKEGYHNTNQNASGSRIAITWAGSRQVREESKLNLMEPFKQTVEQVVLSIIVRDYQCQVLAGSVKNMQHVTKTAKVEATAGYRAFVYAKESGL
ncbi:hypothetical protein GOBAR_AA03566 [Gossypium barbadense]|uniref:Uncharacterized protein n=1 Tax=Gossypium barbadense TaxID=3634 RepID=A0A2P5YN37_GOSBA|nr:hypothetical protein GOBAR_AA03566 [Gossypium barbadense]